MSSAPFIGQRVSIYWRRKKEWFEGAIEGYDIEMGARGKIGYRIHVLHDDGDRFSYTGPPIGDDPSTPTRTGYTYIFALVYTDIATASVTMRAH